MGTHTSPQAPPDKDQDSNSPTSPKFSYTAHGLRHSVGITDAGVAYTWGRTNALGQLGRTTTDRSSVKTPTRVDIKSAKAVKAFVGGSSDSGHTAILDSHGTLWMAGCDRWQQLGLGSAKGGSSGYTWQDGKLWQEQFLATPHLTEFLNENGTKSLRDVALGGDHTLVLSSNQRDVYAFGKGGDGQLGLVGKPFVSGFVRSTVLSSSSREKQKIAAICAVKACSMTMDEYGNILDKAGKCRSNTKEMVDGLESCLARAEQTGLLKRVDKET